VTAIELIAAERRRQDEIEGYASQHDDEHDDETLAQAAAVYATPAGLRGSLGFSWPWHAGPGLKPGDRVRELVKAGALIVAEIERLQRLGS
jgi:hypothetical protein